MSIASNLERLERAQRTLWFKIIASLAIITVAGSLIGGKWLVGESNRQAEKAARAAAIAANERGAPPDKAGKQPSEQNALPTLSDADRERLQAALQRNPLAGFALSVTPEIAKSVQGQSGELLTFEFIVAAAVGVGLIFTWAGISLPALLWGLGFAAGWAALHHPQIGLQAGLRPAWWALASAGAFLLIGAALLRSQPYMLAGLAGGVVGGVLLRWGDYDVPSVMQLALLVNTAVFLGAAFAALRELAKFLLSFSSPAFSVARNVLDEAIRMKIGLVFLLAMLAFLALLPSLLDSGQPLRFRVQSFLSFSSGTVFWIVAILVVFLTTATVAFEQRDKVIWQTMTKPVAAWQYVLGKWLGVWLLSGMLLSVAGVGIYVYTGYLRSQPALGEDVLAVAQPGSMSQDRYELNTRVLTARRSVRPVDISEDVFRIAVESVIAREKNASPDFRDTPDVRQRIEVDVRKQLQQLNQTVLPGERKLYVFDGLEFALEKGLPITLRFKAHAGSNDPQALYPITLLTRLGPQPINCRLDVMLREDLPAQSIDLVNKNNPIFQAPGQPPPTTRPGDPKTGRLMLFVINGRLGPDGLVPNKDALVFPEDKLEIVYPAGAFAPNFARIMLIAWLKLAFLAMVAVCAATFLSFPVAWLVTIGVFLAAEGAGQLGNALENYALVDPATEQWMWWRYPILWVGQIVELVFRFYATMQPSEKLVEGTMVEWSSVGSALLIFGSLTALLGALGSLIFRKRELATYSGQ